MVETALDIYLDAFVAPRRHELDRPVVLTASGVRGVALIRLLGSDDSGYDRLVAEVNGPWRGVVFALDQAPRCNEFMRAQPGWNGHSEMAMVLSDIQAASASGPFGRTTDFFGYDFFQGQQDQVPDPGTLARYAATTSFDSGQGLFEVDIKLADVCCVPYETAVSYDNVEIFGEINNSAAQFPGGINDHVRLRTVGWRNPNLVWHGIDVNTPTSQPQLGWSHPASYSYDIWDKACNS